MPCHCHFVHDILTFVICFLKKFFLLRSVAIEGSETIKVMLEGETLLETHSYQYPTIWTKSIVDTLS